MKIKIDQAGRDQYVELFGHALAEVFVPLLEDVHFLYLLEGQYTELFGEDERVKVLNDAAPFMAAIMQELFFDELILAVARLVDKPQTGQFSNLTMLSLRPLIQDSELSSQLLDLEAKAASAAAVAVRNRHKRLAHQDRAYRLDTQSMEGVTHGQIRQVKKHAGAMLRAVCVHFGGPDLVFGSPAIGDAYDLLCTLWRGNRVERERKERWSRQDYRPDDDSWLAPLGPRLR